MHRVVRFFAVKLRSLPAARMLFPVELYPEPFAPSRTSLMLWWWDECTEGRKKYNSVLQ